MNETGTADVNIWINMIFGYYEYVFAHWNKYIFMFWDSNYMRWGVSLDRDNTIYYLYGFTSIIDLLVHSLMSEHIVIAPWKTQ